MEPSVRLVLVAVIIVGSALYALLVVQNPALASALAAGYVAVLLSIFAAINFWKSS
jgi:hypothetical protein